MRIAVNLSQNLWPKVMKTINYILNRILTKRNKWKRLFEMVTSRSPNFTHLHIYGCKTYIRINMLPKKQKLTRKIHIRYFIKYDSSNIYKILNVNRNKIIKIKNIIFDENSCYDPINIDLNQLINKLFIKIDLFKSIQSNPIEAVRIDLDEKLELNSHLLEFKSHSTVEYSDQRTLLIT